MAMHSLLIGIYFLLFIFLCVTSGFSLAFYLCFRVHFADIQDKNPCILSQRWKMPNFNKIYNWGNYLLWIGGFMLLLLLPLLKLGINCGIGEARLGGLFRWFFGSSYLIFIIFYVIKLRHWVKKTIF